MTDSWIALHSASTRYNVTTHN